MLALAPTSDSAVVAHDLQAEVDRLAKQPMTADELETARRRAESATLFSLQTARGRALALGTSVTATGNEQDVERQLERIRACTAADIQRVAAKFLSAQRRTVVWLAAAPATNPGGVR
jgi:zinc protease